MIPKLAWRNLTRNRRRTLLTIGSVTVALMLLSMLMAVLDAMERAEGAADNRLVVRHAISLTFDLPESYWEKLRGLEHVVAVTPLTWFGGTYIDDRPQNFFAQFACDPQTVLDIWPEYQTAPEELQAFRSERTAFIAGAALAERYGWKSGDRIVLKGTIYPTNMELTLRGTFREPNAPAAERTIFFHRKYLEEALGNPGLAGTFWLRLDSTDYIAQVVQQSEAMFENSQAQVRTETEKAFQLSFLEMLGNVRLFFGAIGCAIVVSILFMTANTMAMAARERTPEVAVLKTLGYRRRQVMTLVLLESALVGLAGAGLGIGLAAALLGGLGKALEENFALFGTLKITPWVAWIGLAVGAGVGVVSGGFPAFEAVRLRIVDGLRRNA